MQTDPIGYEDGTNLYAYVGNDPINLSDPTGLMGVCTFCGRLLREGGFSSKDAFQLGNGGTTRVPSTMETAAFVGLPLAAGGAAVCVSGGCQAAALSTSTFLLGRAPQLTALGVAASRFVAGPGEESFTPQFAGRLAFGLQNFGLEDFASRVGASNLMKASNPVADILSAVADPAQRFIVRLDGLDGGTPREIVELAARRGELAQASGNLSGNLTNFEIFSLQQAGRFDDTIFTLGDEIVNLNP